MKKYTLLFASAVLISIISLSFKQIEKKNKPFVWNSANIYFLLTDRFMNGDTTNDLNFDRTAKAGKFREFMGGDMKGMIQKLEDGYFEKLGIDVIWFSPVFEQVHGAVDEGTGNTFAFHGYWPKDWSRLDPNFGTEEDLAKLVKLAHKKNIRIMMDIVINHRGPVTDKDPNFEADFVRTAPQCTYQDSKTTIPCTLVKNLPDVITESNDNVRLPLALVEKFRKEGRYEKEMAELDAFFANTGHPRAPRFYIMKWILDLIKDYGIDGFRVDTAKHTEASIWAELAVMAQKTFAEWKLKHPEEVLDTNKFHMLGEVYNYSIENAQDFDFGDMHVNYFQNGFNSLINFGFKSNATSDYETLFSKYDVILQTQMNGNTVLNYLASHDDGGPFDKKRIKPIESGTKLLLAPGMSQIYYGDESNRCLDYADAQGDATLRSFMNWDEIKNSASARNGFLINDVLKHYQKLGMFRKEHCAIGAGKHTMLSKAPYYFKREYVKNNYSDKVVVGLDLAKGMKSVPVSGVFTDGTVLVDYYSNQKVVVKNGTVAVNSDFDIVLLGVK